jgi:diadenosine tetraphosphate (Ap4A) HIT family hydrolase
MTDICPFCQPDSEQIWFEDQTGFVLRDAYPISQGHALVIPRQHTVSLFQLPIDTQAALWQLVSEARRRIDEELRPDGFNVGVNDGEAAGQTVMHAHIHVIPRWTDDVADPRGGIRWVIPEKARYWGDE